jgi:phosphoglucosamine mutase
VKLFGTDGIRAEAGKFPLDLPTVYRIGRIFGRRIRRAGAFGIIGGDTRESMPGFLGAIAEGIGAEGVALQNAGVVPTPAIADLVRELGAAFGIAISASHNPWRDNGIKFFGPDGRKLADGDEAAIEAALPAEKGEPAGGPSPSVRSELAESYAARLISAVPGRIDGVSVALDCGNGSAFELAPRIFERAGARVEALGTRPDGRNINEGCGALHPEGLSSLVRDGRFHLGAAFDGDADRLILCDEMGRTLDGDDVLWMLARDAHVQGRLDPPIVVGTVMTNFGLERSLASLGVKLRRTPVGDRHVVRAMQETGARLGGETSGHIILGDLSTTGDGTLAALCVAALLAREHVPLSQLADLRKAPQVLRNLEPRAACLDGRAPGPGGGRRGRELGGDGRVLLHCSGTEPLLGSWSGTDRVEEWASPTAFAPSPPGSWERPRPERTRLRVPVPTAVLPRPLSLGVPRCFRLAGYGENSARASEQSRRKAPPPDIPQRVCPVRCPG